MYFNINLLVSVLLVCVMYIRQHKCIKSLSANEDYIGDLLAHEVGIYIITCTAYRYIYEHH
jgi:hypothetical protein